MPRHVTRVMPWWVYVLRSCVGAVLLAPQMGWAVGQAAPRPPMYVTTWVVYWDPASRSVIEDAGTSLDTVSVFAYHFGPEGRLMPATPWVAETVQALMARAPRPRVLVTVVNDVVAEGAPRLKDARCVHEAVRTPETIAAHVEELAAIAATADGIEIDYEHLRAADREGFTRLITALGRRLHAQGKWLSVVAQPKLEDRVGHGAGAIDWRAISEAADRITLMAYYEHSSSTAPGPTASPAWVERLARFASSQIPPDKLCVVLSFNGYDWPHGGAGRQVEYEAALRAAATYRARVQRDARTEAPFFRYARGAARHEVWFEDARSLQRKLRVLRDLEIRHVGLWHIGSGSPVYDAALALNDGD